MEELIFDKTMNKMLEFKKTNLVKELKNLLYMFLIPIFRGLTSNHLIFYQMLIFFVGLLLVIKLIENVKTSNELNFYTTLLILALNLGIIMIATNAWLYQIPNYIQLSYIYKLSIYTTYFLNFRNSSRYSKGMLNNYNFSFRSN